MAMDHFNTSSDKRYSLVDGVFADDGGITADGAVSTWGVSPAVAARFAAGHTQLLKEATAAMSEGGGLLVENGGPIAKIAGNAYMFETFSPNNETINALFELAKLGKVVQGESSNGPDTAPAAGPLTQNVAANSPHRLLQRREEPEHLRLARGIPHRRGARLLLVWTVRMGELRRSGHRAKMAARVRHAARRAARARGV